MEKIHAVKTSLFGKGSIALLPDEQKREDLQEGLLSRIPFCIRAALRTG